MSSRVQASLNILELPPSCTPCSMKARVRSARSCGQGVRNTKMEFDDYHDLLQGTEVSKTFTMFKKHRTFIPKGLRQDGVKEFDINIAPITRTLGKTQWKGRERVIAPDIEPGSWITLQWGFDKSILTK